MTDPAQPPSDLDRLIDASTAGACAKTLQRAVRTEVDRLRQSQTIKCLQCNGKGIANFYGDRSCSRCGGSGLVQSNVLQVPSWQRMILEGRGQDETLLAHEPTHCPCRYCSHLRHRLEVWDELLAGPTPATFQNQEKS